MAAVFEEHNLQLLNNKVYALLNHEPNKLAVKDNLTFSFHKPKDLMISEIFSLLLKPPSFLFKTLRGRGTFVFSVAFSPDNKLIASTSFKAVHLWNIPNGDLTRARKWWDGKSIVTGSDDNNVRTWSVATKQQLKTLKGHSSYVNSVAWSPNGDVTASGSNDKTVILWDATSGSATKTLTGHTSDVWSVSISQNGNKLASAGSYDNSVIIWDVNSGAALIKLAHSDYVLSVCFSHDDQSVVTGCADDIVRIFSANTGHEEKRFEGHMGSVRSVACSFDGSMIASGSWDKSVRLWDVASTKQLQQLDGHTSNVNSVAFSRDGKFIASGSHDTTVCLWNAPLIAAEKFERNQSVVSVLQTFFLGGWLKF